jgi:hypothetical protein
MALKIRAGYDIAFEGSHDVPMVLMLSVHPSRQADLLSAHQMQFSPNVPAETYTDMFGNICTRLVAPAGLIEIANEFVIQDSGLPDAVVVDAVQAPVSGVAGRRFGVLAGESVLRYAKTFRSRLVPVWLD